MKSILEYNSYRKYIFDFYVYKKKTSHFSWRSFSALAGFSSPVFLKRVCESQSNLSKRSANRVANALELTGFEKDFFINLVSYEHEKNEVKRKAIALGQQTILKKNSVKIIGKDIHNFYDFWLNSVIRELAPMMSNSTPDEMARKCYQSVCASHVKKSIDFLLSKNLIIRNSNGKYEQSEKILKGSSDNIPLEIRSMNRQMAKFAVDAIDRFSTEERYISGITMGISSDAYNKIICILKECQSKITDLISKDSNEKQVYRLNLQLFPLTEKV